MIVGPLFDLSAPTCKARPGSPTWKPHEDWFSQCSSWTGRNRISAFSYIQKATEIDPTYRISLNSPIVCVLLRRYVLEIFDFLFGKYSNLQIYFCIVLIILIETISF